MNELIPAEVIERRIYLIRGQKVMLDRDLAELYQVETRTLNQAVSRNLDRFPADFMFQLSKEETRKWISQIVISNSEKMGIRRKPYAFTEQGIAMLSSVLHSPRAIHVNIQIVRAFVKLRKIMASNRAIRRKIEVMEKKYDSQFKIVFDAIKKILIQEKKPRRMIGFHVR